MSREKKTEPPSRGTKEKRKNKKEHCIIIKKGEEVELGAPKLSARGKKEVE